MYNNILHKSLVLKPNVSNAGRELLEGLLQKDRTKRLGVKDDFVSVFVQIAPLYHIPRTERPFLASLALL